MIGHLVCERAAHAQCHRGQRLDCGQQQGVGQVDGEQRGVLPRAVAVVALVVRPPVHTDTRLDPGRQPMQHELVDAQPHRELPRRLLDLDGRARVQARCGRGAGARAALVLRHWPIQEEGRRQCERYLHHDGARDELHPRAAAARGRRTALGMLGIPRVGRPSDDVRRGARGHRALVHPSANQAVAAPPAPPYGFTRLLPSKRK